MEKMNSMPSLVIGVSVTPGYHRRPDLTEAAFDDEGYYRPGDAVSFADAADPTNDDHHPACADCRLLRIGQLAGQQSLLVPLPVTPGTGSLPFSDTS